MGCMVQVGLGEIAEKATVSQLADCQYEHSMQSYFPEVTFLSFADCCGEGRVPAVQRVHYFMTTRICSSRTGKLTQGERNQDSDCLCLMRGG